MSAPELKNKFVAYIDVLGFKDLEVAAESGRGMSLSDLLETVKKLGTGEDQKKFKDFGPVICPGSKHVDRDLDFTLLQVSDCVIVSSEVSPAGLINLVFHCWSAVFGLLLKGFLCRGYITLGAIYHTANQIVGSGYQKAHDRESQVIAFRRRADERGTPFVEVDPTVCDYVRANGDECVKEQFSRFAKTEGGVTALFPFKKLSRQFIVAGVSGRKFDPQTGKAV